MCVGSRAYSDCDKSESARGKSILSTGRGREPNTGCERRGVQNIIHTVDQITCVAVMTLVSKRHLDVLARQRLRQRERASETASERERESMEEGSFCTSAGRDYVVDVCRPRQRVFRVMMSTRRLRVNGAVNQRSQVKQRVAKKDASKRVYYCKHVTTSRL